MYRYICVQMYLYMCMYIIHTFIPYICYVCQVVCLSDRNVTETRMPIDSLLAIGAVHQHLIAQKLRTLTGLMIESGSAHQVHPHTITRDASLQHSS